MIFLYNNTDNLIKAEINKFSYSGTFLGECFVTATIESPEAINFEIGDFFHFRGEKFVLNYVPAKQKKAKKNTHGLAFVYDNIKFNSLSDELTRIEFLDVVLPDNTYTIPAFRNFHFMPIT